MIADAKVTALSALLIAGLATSPLLLHVVRLGVIEGWVEALERDPRNREVVLVGEAGIDAERLGRIAGWPQTGFVVPETSVFISAVRLSSAQGRPARLDMRTSAPGDPILGPATAPADDTVTLTAEAAALLGVDVGDMVDLHLRREPRDRPREFIDVPLRVAGVVPEDIWPGRIAFLSPDRAAGAVRWIGRADQPTLTPGRDAALAAGEEDWRSLRIYAADLRQVAALRDRLRAEGFEARLDTDQVARLLRLSDGLSTLANAVLAATAGVFALTILLIQWLALVRKRRDVALMSAAGLRFGEISGFFVLQAVVITSLGLVLSLAALPLAQAVATKLAASMTAQSAAEGVALAPMVMAAAAAVALAIAVCGLSTLRLHKLDVARLLRGD